MKAHILHTLMLEKDKHVNLKNTFIFHFTILWISLTSGVPVGSLYSIEKWVDK